MRTSCFFLLSFAASVVLGYKIITPNASVNWTNSGPQPATWQRDASDPLNFTVVLTNSDSDFYSNQVLEALVNGSFLSTTFLPPADGWPVGDGFRLLFVKDINDQNTLFAKSDDFSIDIPSQSSNTSTVAKATPTPVASPSSTGNSGFTAQTTDTPQATGTSNHGYLRSDVHAALLGMSGLVGLFMLA